MRGGDITSQSEQNQAEEYMLERAHMQIYALCEQQYISITTSMSMDEHVHEHHEHEHMSMNTTSIT